MKCRLAINAIVLALLFVLSPVSGKERKSIDLKRSACANIVGECQLPYTFSDVAQYVKTVEQHPDASPSQAYMDKFINLSLGPIDLLPGNLMHFNENGELIKLWIYNAREFAGLHVPGKTTFTVHPNGAIASLQLDKPHMINGKFYPSQTSIELDASGNVLKNDFYPNPPSDADIESKLKRATDRVENSLELNKISAPIYQGISVNVNGDPHTISFSNGMWNDQTYYPRNTKLPIDIQGRVVTEEFYARLRNSDEIEISDQSFMQFLTKPIVLGSLTLPAGTVVERNFSNYYAAHLLEETEVCGKPVQWKSIGMQYYNNGTFSLSLAFDHEVEIQGFKLKADLKSYNKKVNVHYHDNCAFKSAVLSTARTWKGFPLAAGEKFELDRKGDLVSGTTGAPYKIKNIEISAGTTLSYNPRYSVGVALFAGGVVSDRDREYKSEFMQIYKHGVISKGALNKPAFIDGKEYPKGSFLSFHPNGELQKAELP